MHGNKWIRQIHRWLSIAFTLAVIANIAAMGMAEPAVWIGLLALCLSFRCLSQGFTCLRSHMSQGGAAQTPDTMAADAIDIDEKSGRLRPLPIRTEPDA